MTSDQLKDYIASKQEERGNLLRRYSEVRPGWVSCDLALLDHTIANLKKELEQLNA